MSMGVTVISTFGTGVPFKLLSTTITDIIPNLDSVGALSQEIELKNKTICRMSNFKIQIFTNNTFLLNYFEYEYNKLQENLDQCVLLKIEHFIEYKIYFQLFK